MYIPVLIGNSKNITLLNNVSLFLQENSAIEYVNVKYNVISIPNKSGLEWKVWLLQFCYNVSIYKDDHFGHLVFVRIAT